MKMKGVDKMAGKEASWDFQCLGYHIAPHPISNLPTPKALLFSLCMPGN